MRVGTSASVTCLVTSTLVENEESAEAIAGRQCRALRMKRGWSQTDLARRMSARGFEMSQTTVAKLENGKRPLRVDELVELAGIFGTGIVELLTTDETVGDVVRDHEVAYAINRVWELRASLDTAEAMMIDLDARRAAASAHIVELRQALFEAQSEVERLGAKP